VSDNTEEPPIDWKWYGDHGWACMGKALSALEAIAWNPNLPNVQPFAADAVAAVRAEAESIKDYRRHSSTHTSDGSPEPTESGTEN
jgi:hypothetical protein